MDSRIVGRLLGIIILAAMVWIIVVVTVAITAWATVTMIEFVEGLR